MTWLPLRCVTGRPKSSNKRSVAELERPGSAQAAPYQQQMQPEPIPLKYVVQEAVKRWFEDTLLEAQRGDVKQQALLGERYKVGRAGYARVAGGRAKVSAFRPQLTVARGEVGTGRC